MTTKLNPPKSRNTDHEAAYLHKLRRLNLAQLFIVDVCISVLLFWQRLSDRINETLS